MRDLHGVVVNNIGKVVCREAVALDKDKVVARCFDSLGPHLAVDQVGEGSRLDLRSVLCMRSHGSVGQPVGKSLPDRMTHFKAHCMWLSLLPHLTGFFDGVLLAVAVIALQLAGFLVSLPHVVQAVLRAEAGICATMLANRKKKASHKLIVLLQQTEKNVYFYQVLNVIFVDVKSLRLHNTRAMSLVLLHFSFRGNALECTARKARLAEDLHDRNSHQRPKGTSVTRMRD